MTSEDPIEMIDEWLDPDGISEGKAQAALEQVKTLRDAAQAYFDAEPAPLDAEAVLYLARDPKWRHARGLAMQDRGYARSALP